MFRSLLQSKKEFYHHLQGNPRNIKRIFNIISMMGSLFQAFQKANVCYAFKLQFIPVLVSERHIFWSSVWSKTDSSKLCVFAILSESSQAVADRCAILQINTVNALLHVVCTGFSRFRALKK